MRPLLSHTISILPIYFPLIIIKVSFSINPVFVSGENITLSNTQPPV